MSQHVVKVCLLIDAKDQKDCEVTAYHLLQELFHQNEIINWTFDGDPDTDVVEGAFKVTKPIRSARHTGAGVENKMLSEYARARAIHVLTKETTNV